MTAIADDLKAIRERVASILASIEPAAVRNEAERILVAVERFEAHAADFIKADIARVEHKAAEIVEEVEAVFTEEPQPEPTDQAAPEVQAADSAE